LSDTAQPPKKGKSLVAEAKERLGAMIREQGLKPGDRLPSEHVLTEQLSISRSVLREAVASLRAEGRVSSRRGSGVFVSQGDVSRPFRIAQADVVAVPGIVQLLELRAAVEIEAAGLAASRRTRAQADGIEAALVRLDQEMANGSVGSEEDFNFHRTIAEATGNPHFASFLTYIRDMMIPRERVRLETDSALASEAYFHMLQREHHEIQQAIAVGDEIGARTAMRNHLQGSARRYQRWAEEAAAVKS
jgi:GntR family transcriptional repressor for pyruvate dehydrogenase complex